MQSSGEDAKGIAETAGADVMLAINDDPPVCPKIK